MKLIVGLGNPGIKYAMTRHNVGFMVIDHIFSILSLTNEKEGFKGSYIKTNINGEDVIFLKPLTYMNNSGISVQEIVNYYKISIENVLVIHDDLDLPVGYLRLRERSSSGGHNGIKSIIECLNSDCFKRIRIGISKDKQIETADYVLGKFSLEEKVLIKKALELAAEASLDWLKEDFNKTMNKYNKKKES